MYKEYRFFTNQGDDLQDVSISVRGAPHVAYFKIHEVTIPLAFNSTDASNNRVVFERDGTKYEAILPPGSYNALTFSQALTAALNTVTAIKDFGVTFDDTKHIMTITAGGNFTIRPFPETTAYRQLGMTKFTRPTTGSSVLFGVADLTNTAPILLTSNSLVSRDLTYLGEENSSVLCMLHCDAPQNSVLNWVNNGSYVSCGAELPYLSLQILNAATMLPLQINQPFSVTFSILTDEDDVELYS